jgi:cobalt-zinc-cadmium resistance protein CzcA
VFEGDQRFDLVVRLPMHAQRSDVLQRLTVPLLDGHYVPLSGYATLKLHRVTTRPTARTADAASWSPPIGRDLGSFVEMQMRVNDASNCHPATGEYGGTFEQLISATQRLQIVVPLVLLLIIGLLYMALNSIKDALLVFSGVPGIAGGVWAGAARHSAYPSLPPSASSRFRVSRCSTVWCWCPSSAS